MHKGAHNVKPIMSKMTYEKLTWLVSESLKENFEGITPKEWQDVLKRWEQDST